MESSMELTWILMRISNTPLSLWVCIILTTNTEVIIYSNEILRKRVNWEPGYCQISKIIDYKYDNNIFQICHNRIFKVVVSVVSYFRHVKRVLLHHNLELFVWSIVLRIFHIRWFSRMFCIAQDIVRYQGLTRWYMLMFLHSISSASTGLFTER